jgi:predicted nucleic acid-binding protein
LSDHIIDTVALLRYLDEDLPKTADWVLRLAEAGRGRLLLPRIVIGEFVDLALGG